MLRQTLLTELDIKQIKCETNPIELESLLRDIEENFLYHQQIFSIVWPVEYKEYLKKRES